jgi:hypothetical protein
MNDRIKRFALKSGAKICGGYVTPSGSVPMVWSDTGGIDTTTVDLQKFSELLLNECAEIPNRCIETGKDQLVETCMADRASSMIKKHFGLT